MARAKAPDVRRLLAAERGTIHKDAPTRVALVYPSPYRAAMSSLGYQTIYRRLNDLPGVAADRAMLPEPSPAPVKYWLYRQGLIDSPEVRLPLTAVSPALAERIDRAIESQQAVPRQRHLQKQHRERCLQSEAGNHRAPRKRAPVLRQQPRQRDDDANSECRLEVQHQYL